MTRRGMWGIGGVLLMTGLALAAPETPVFDRSTNPVVDNVQSGASEDTLTEELWRDPFWPVGYSPVTKTVPAPASQTPEESVGPVAEETLKRALSTLPIGGIMKRGTNYVAIVNGTLVEAGDTIPVLVDDTWVIFTVRSVDMRRIRLEPVKQ